MNRNFKYMNKIEFTKKNIKKLIQKKRYVHKIDDGWYIKHGQST